MNQDPSQDCLICRKHAGLEAAPGGPIYQDALIYVVHAPRMGEAATAYLGYLFVETQRHIPGLGDLTAAEAQAVGQAATRLARALEQVTGVEHVYAFVLGDGIPHFHLHLIGRYPGAPRPYWGPRVDEWPDAPHGDAAAVAALVRQLQAWLTAHPT